MRSFLLGLGLMAVFAAGCMAGASSLGVPKAEAARVEEQRWSYFCFDASSTDDLHTKANAAGARGWEMVSGVASPSGITTWCFRQPRP
ncbi:MAG TPA: hypothetical protein VHB79_38695 [Polyangiaceae bacterium]|nr:hypothetical protein [Polyangiaceae bacterium]